MNTKKQAERFLKEKGIWHSKIINANAKEINLSDLLTQYAESLIPGEATEKLESLNETLKEEFKQHRFKHNGKWLETSRFINWLIQKIKQ